MKNLVFSFLIVIVSMQIFASKPGSNPVRANANEITNFFDDEIKDRKILERQVEDLIEKAKSPIENKSALSEINGNENDMEKKIEQEISKVNSINEFNLESKGREEREKEENSFFDKLEINHNDKSVSAHKTDTDRIADESGDLLSELKKKFLEHGIDCKEEEGNDEDITKEDEEERGLDYREEVCEELRNAYECTEFLNLNCASRGTAWNNWEDKVIDMEGVWIHRNKMSWLMSIKYANRAFGMHIQNAPWVLNEIRVEIARRLNVSLEHIDVKISLHGGIGSRVRVAHKEYIEPLIRFGYRFRTTRAICSKWNEQWVEVCKLK